MIYTIECSKEEMSFMISMIFEKITERIGKNHEQAFAAFAGCPIFKILQKDKDLWDHFFEHNKK